jgi:hypothetical protein
MNGVNQSAPYNKFKIPINVSSLCNITTEKTSRGVFISGACRY